MILGEFKHARLLAKLPHAHRSFSGGPHFGRRRFFELLGAGVTGSYLAGSVASADGPAALAITPQYKAKNVIFILCTGAPSHVDTFDLKVTSGVTPSNFNVTKVNGIDWPSGLLPKIGQQLGKICIVRSVRAWALVHSLGQTWVQIGRNPAAALGDVSPNVGCVVASEKEAEKTATQIFPTFLALNAGGCAGPGYFPANYAPFKVTPSTSGVPNITNVDGQTRHDARLQFLHKIDDNLRKTAVVSDEFADMDAFYSSARGLMYNNSVNSAFSYSSADSARYGNSAFGNACLVAKQTLSANLGTRYIQINVGGWDMHQDIYGTQNANGSNLYTLGRDQFDPGVAALLADLESSGLLKETLVVMGGEFGRTVGPLSGAGGRDHYPQQFVAFAGAGVRGGRVLGATNAKGDDVADYGWKYNRYVRWEDIEATIYSAMGIDWTKQLDTPFGRTFEYVPFASEGAYGPIDELWT